MSDKRKGNESNMPVRQAGNSPGVVKENDMKAFVTKFIEAISAHRHWNRQVV